MGMEDKQPNSPLGMWVVDETHKRGWSLREVARRTRSDERPAGFTVTTIADIAKGSATTPDVCKGLAHAFGVSYEEVLARAGILPDIGGVLPEVRNWSDRLRRFNSEDRQRLARMVEQLLDLAESAHKIRAGNGADLAPVDAETEAVG